MNINGHGQIKNRHWGPHSVQTLLRRWWNGPTEQAHEKPTCRCRWIDWGKTQEYKVTETEDALKKKAQAHGHRKTFAGTILFVIPLIPPASWPWVNPDCIRSLEKCILCTFCLLLSLPARIWTFICHISYWEKRLGCNVSKRATAAFSYTQMYTIKQED